MSHAPHDISERLHRGLGWWHRELAALIPGRVKSGVRGKRLVLDHSDQHLALAIEHGGVRTELARTPYVPFDPAALDRALADGGPGLARLPIVLRVDRSALLTRHVVLPSAALADADRICALDLERGTPFNRADVLVAHDPAPGAALPGKVRLRQSVAKKDALQPAMALLARHGLAADRIECAAPDVHSGPELVALPLLREAAAPLTQRGTSAVATLAASAVFLAGLAIAIDTLKRERAAAHLETALATARTEFEARRAAEARAGAAQQQVNTIQTWVETNVSRPSLLETVTRLLPDSDYLTSLRFDGSEIELSGYSASTTALVQRLERSGQFRETTLGADTVLDARTGKERFSLKTRVTGQTVVTR